MPFSANKQLSVICNLSSVFLHPRPRIVFLDKKLPRWAFLVFFEGKNFRGGLLPLVGSSAELLATCFCVTCDLHPRSFWLGQKTGMTGECKNRDIPAKLCQKWPCVQTPKTKLKKPKILLDMMKNVCNSEFPFLRFFMQTALVSNPNIPGLPNGAVKVTDAAVLQMHVNSQAILLVHFLRTCGLKGSPQFYKKNPEAIRLLEECEPDSPQKLFSADALDFVEMHRRGGSTVLEIPQGKDPILGGSDIPGIPEGEEQVGSSPLTIFRGTAGELQQVLSSSGNFELYVFPNPDAQANEILRQQVLVHFDRARENIASIREQLARAGRLPTK